MSRASLDAPMDDHVYSMDDKLYRQQNRDFHTSEAFLKHVAFLLAKADIMVTDWNELRTVSHDPNWYRSSTEPQEAIQQFYVLVLPVLRTRAGVSPDMPPEPRRAAPDRNISEVIHLAFTHATNQGNVVAIMREGRLAASKLHHSDSESFFAQGFKLGQTTWDDQGLGRILHNGTTLSKNECGVVFLGLAWGTGEVVHQGGEGQCIAMAKPGKHGCVHHKRGRIWMISTQSHVLQGLAWNSQEKAPSSIFS